MKKAAALLLVLLLLLTACGHGETESTAAEESESTRPGNTLMESRQPVGTLGNTWVLPNAPVEAMENPELYLFEESLLLYSNVYSEGLGNHSILKRISLIDGSLLAECSFPCGSYVTIQIGEAAIGICDPELGAVRCFDPELTETTRYSLQSSSDSWYLSRDLERVYSIRWDSGIEATELATGETHALLTDATEVLVCNSTRDYVTVSYLDLTTQKYTGRLLDLESGTVEKLPVEGRPVSALRVEDAWLIGGAATGEYRLVQAGKEESILRQENRIDLLAPQAQLLTVDGGTLCLYDTQGKFLSRCVLPGDGVYAGHQQVWSELWGGYFFLSLEGSAFGKLMFWDPTVPVSGEDLPLQAVETPGGTSADPALYERAASLGAQYGVEIRIADQCQVDYDYYTSFELADTAFLSAALDTLTNALASYPEGFFRQLPYGDIRTIRMELVSGLAPKPGTALGDTAAAFAQKLTDVYLIVFDVYSLSERNIHHEITHVIDRRLEWDAALRDSALFSEEAWMALNPQGFAYACAYGELPSDVAQYAGTGYFASDYGMTFPTEDRATMMENAICDQGLSQEFWAGLLSKLDYYSRCLRDCFDTTGWPEVTAWEAVLSE